MKKAIGTLLLILTLSVSSCSPVSDATGPDVGPVKDLALTQVDARASLSKSTVHFLVQSGDAPLETLQATFTAVAGERHTFEVRYDVPEGQQGPSPHFFQLDLHNNTLLARPDGTPFAEGETVLITVTIDPSDLRVQLEPSGLLFDPDEPALLKLWYSRANPDLNGDGQVDSLDTALENDGLGVWVRPGSPTSGADWTLLDQADHDLLAKRFKAEIEHFSGYVVAW